MVVIDERAKRNGAYLELLGTYNPLTTPHDIQLKKDRIDHWLKLGAVKSDGFLRIIGEAPPRPPRKPKKVKKESSAISPQITETPTQEAASSEQQVVSEEQPVQSDTQDQATKREPAAQEAEPAPAGELENPDQASEGASAEQTETPEPTQVEEETKDERPA